MTTSVPPLTMSSVVTARAVAHVAEHKAAAEALGTALADLTPDPDAFATALRRGLASLADPEYHAGQQRVAPGIGPIHGVRWLLGALAAVSHGFRQATRNQSPPQRSCSWPIGSSARRNWSRASCPPSASRKEQTLATETERTLAASPGARHARQVTGSRDSPCSTCSR